MRYFSSDFHFGDERLNLFGRDLIAKNSEDIDNLIITNYNNIITDDDTVYFNGDVAVTLDGLKKVSLLKGYKILIKGNYDQQFTQEQLSEYFHEIYENKIIDINGEPVFINHYPTNCLEELFNITAHVHGVWKVQRNMVNVGVDAWHFQPVSEDMIIFQMNGIRNHYDINVFAGELIANNKTTDVDKHKYQLNWVKQKSYWLANNGEMLVIVKSDDKYHATISYKPYFFKGIKEEVEEKFKVKIHE
jgi:calcineurin-like phosphoesterase family protein